MTISDTRKGNSIVSCYRPTAYLIEPETVPLSSLALYRLVCTGFTLAKVKAMVASSPLYESSLVLERILGHSNRRGQYQRSARRGVLLNAMQCRVQQLSNMPKC